MTEYQNARTKDVIPAIQGAFKDSFYSYDKPIHIVGQDKLKIQPECLDVCKILGSKNIFAYAALDYKTKESYIEIKVEDIAPENQDIITSLKEPYVKKRGKNNSVIISVKGVGIGPQKRLTELAQLFLLQDVPEHRLYISREDVLKECGFVNSIQNSNYIPFEEFNERKKNSNSKCEDNTLQQRMQEHEYQIRQKIAERGFTLDENTGLYYRNGDYFARHLAYLQENMRQKARERKTTLLQEKKLKFQHLISKQDTRAIMETK